MKSKRPPVIGGAGFFGTGVFAGWSDEVWSSFVSTTFARGFADDVGFGFFAFASSLTRFASAAIVSFAVSRLFFSSRLEPTN